MRKLIIIMVFPICLYTTGCSQGDPKRAIEEYIGTCDGTLSGEFHVGNWGNKMILKCDKIGEDMVDRL